MEEFRKLRAYWYEKLAEIGFEDIEELKGDDLVLKEPCRARFRNNTPFSALMKQEYFNCMAQRAFDPETIYKSETDKIVLTRHCEGAKIKTILEELMSLGITKHRHSVRCIIRRYEMAWDIRHYERKQLLLKEIK